MRAKDTVMLNINDEVEVRLSPEGIIRYDRFYEALALKGGTSYQKIRPVLVKNKDGWCTFQLWDLMNIFGPKTYLGGPQFFLGNVIRIKR